MIPMQPYNRGHLTPLPSYEIPYEPFYPAHNDSYLSPFDKLLKALYETKESAQELIASVEGDTFRLTDHLFQKIYTSYETLYWESLNDPTVLTLLDSKGASLFFGAIRDADPACVSTLIQKLDPNTLINHVDHDLRTGLHIAAIYGRVDLIDLLVTNGLCAINCQDQWGLTPLQWAIHEGHLDMVIALINHGASLEHYKNFSFCSIPISIENFILTSGHPSIFKYFLNSQKLFSTSLVQSTPLMGNALHLALQTDQTHLLYYLPLEELIFGKDFLGRTPLQLAAFMGNTQAIEILVTEEAPIHEGEHEQHGTPLHYAALGEQPEAIHLLLSYGVDINRVDQRGNTPLAQLKDQNFFTAASTLCINILENAKKSPVLEKGKISTKFYPQSLIFEGNYDQKQVFIESIRLLESQNMFKHLERVSGIGMGSIIALLLSIGCSSSEFQQLLPDSLVQLLHLDASLKEALPINLGSLKIRLSLSLDTDTSKIQKAQFFDQIIGHQGACQLEKITHHLEHLIQGQTGVSHLTFGELRSLIQKEPLRYKHLHLFLSSSKDKKIRHVNSEDPYWDECIISHTLAASLAIPGIFSPQPLTYKKKLGEIVSSEHLYFAPLLEKSFLDLFENCMQQSLEKMQSSLLNIVMEYDDDFSTLNSQTLSSMTAQALFTQLARLYTHLAKNSTFKAYTSKKQLFFSFSSIQESSHHLRRLQEKFSDLVIPDHSFVIQDKMESSVLSEIKPWKYIKLFEIFRKNQSLSKKNSTQYCHLPLLTRSFTGREDVLHHIDEAFKTHHRVSIIGLGGVGKSTLAIKYGSSFKQNYKLIFYILAESKETFIQGLLTLANVVGIQERKTEDKLKKLKLFLQTIIQPYLLIIDGLDQPELMDLLEEHLPYTDQCKILLTTRMEITYPQFQALHLECFSEQEALDYMFKETRILREPAEELAAKKVLKQLGALPLALTLASRYIRCQGDTIRSYLEKLKSHKLNLFDKAQQYIPGNESLLTVWDISMKSLESKEGGKLAKQLAQFIALLGHTLIPFDLLLAWGETLHIHDEFAVRKALGLLMEYSLIQKASLEKEKIPFYQVHMLVQQVIEHRMDSLQQEIYLLDVWKALDQQLKAIVERHEFRQIILTTYGIHTESLLSKKELFPLIKPQEREQLTASLIKIYTQCGLFHKALKYAQKELSCNQLNDQKEFLQLAKSYETVGNIFYLLEDFESALKQGKAALEIIEKNSASSSLMKIKLYHLIAKAISHLKDDTQAQDYIIRSITLIENLPEKKPLLLAEGYELWSNILHMKGNHQEALIKILKALKIRETASQQKPHLLLKSNDFIQKILVDTGDIQEALKISLSLIPLKEEIFGENALTVAESYMDLGNIFQQLGHLDKALNSLSKALSIQCTVLGQESQPAAKSYTAMSHIFSLQGNLNDALIYAQKSLEISLKTFGENSIQTAVSYDALVPILSQLGNLHEALEKASWSLEIKEKLFPSNSLALAKAYDIFSPILHLQGQTKKALEISFKSLKIKQTIYSEKTLDISNSHQQISQFLLGIGSPQDALEHALNALSIRRYFLEETSPYIGGSFFHIGHIYEALGNPEEALNYFKKSLINAQHLFGQESIPLAILHKSIGNIYHTQGKIDEALNETFTSLLITEKYFGKESPMVISIRLNLSKILCSKGYMQDALYHSQESLIIAKKIFPYLSPMVAATHSNLSSILHSLGNLPQALEYGLAALDIGEMLSSETPFLASQCYEIAQILLSLGKVSQAFEYSLKSLALGSTLFGKDSIQVAENYRLHAKILHTLGKLDEAIVMCYQALNLQMKILKSDSPLISYTHNIAATILQDRGKFEDALFHIKQALHLSKKLFGNDSLLVALNRQIMSQTLSLLGRFPKALKHITKALEIIPSYLGEQSFEAARNHSIQGEIFHKMRAFEKAHASVLKALDTVRNLFGENSPMTASMYSLLSEILLSSEKPHEALEMAFKSLQTNQFLLTNVSPHTARNHAIIKDIYCRLGQLNQALHHAKMFLAIQQQLKKEHPAEFHDVAHILLQLGRIPEALQYAHLALELAQQKFGIESLPVAISYEQIGQILRTSGKLDQALTMSQRALFIQEYFLGKDSLPVGKTHYTIAAILHSSNHMNEALTHAQQALAIAIKHFGDKTLPTISSYELNGFILNELRQQDQALTMCLLALEIQQKNGVQESIGTASLHDTIAKILSKLGRMDEALHHAYCSLKITETLLGKESYWTSITYNTIGELLIKLKRFDEALEINEKALQIRQHCFSEISPYTARSYYNKGIILQEIGRLNEALYPALCSLKIRQKLFGENSICIAISSSLIRDLFQKMGKFEEALEYGIQSWKIYQQLDGKESPSAASSYLIIKTIFEKLNISENDFNNFIHGEMSSCLSPQ